MTTTIFQAAQDGNVELVSSLLEHPSLEIDARDDAGLTALHYAVRASHIQVVSQLLAKGANALEVANDDALKQNPELASVVNNALQHTQSTAFQTAPVIDSHGGKQLPDGTVSYVQPPVYQNNSLDGSVQQQQQHLVHQHPMSQPAYPFQPQHAFFDPSHNPEHRVHAAKDSSSGSLPPPEVARMIPCRFFPNCRYGEKCIFAHPVPVGAASSSAGPVSPGQGPMFFQSPTYGYPAYGPPQHFYSMAPPMPLQYAHAGVPMPVHMPPPPHMAPAQHSADSKSYGHQFASHSRQQFAPQPAQEGQSAPASSDASQDAAAHVTDSAPADAEADQADSASESKPTAKASAEPAKRASTSASPSATTTTSFSAFMAHHAAPFQPGPAQNGVSVGADGSFLTGPQPTSRGSKGARRGGASLGASYGQRSEVGKRSSERPACLFFARSACKHGEDCRFPHILPDGTDARGPNAGRSNHSIEASRAINRALAAKNSKASNNGASANGNNANHASTAANTTAPGEVANLPATPRDVSVSTSPASAQTTIPASLQKNEGASKPSADRSASRTEAADKTTTSAASGSVKKDHASKANAAASASSNKSSGSNAPSAGKTEAKADNAANGKRGAGAAKTEEGKAAATASVSSQGDRIPASVPSKPLVNGNSNGAANRQTGAKPQANGVQGGKGQNNQNGARSRANQGSAGRANGQGAQGGAAQKKAAPQRLPSADDFPALSNGQGPAAAGPAPAAAGNTNGVAKANFSAILSAPAPVKKQPEPTKEPEAAATTDDKAAAAPAPSSEAKEAGASTKEAETTTPLAKPAGTTGAAAQMMDFAAVVQSNPVAV